MAIYSLNHTCVGRSTHRAGTAGAHIKYIARHSAASVIMAEHMPNQPKWARRFMTETEENSRANARVIDKIMVALPLELNTHQRAALIKRFVNNLTKGECPWFAVIHQKEKDRLNPHCHILIRDKSVLSGRRVVLFSERGSTTKIREQWAHDASMALREAGYDIKLDHRSYREQGIDKIPGRHRGPKWHAEQRRMASMKAEERHEQTYRAVKEAKRQETPLYLMDHWMPAANDDPYHRYEHKRAYSAYGPEP